jgi:hypothetical protein
VLFRSSFNNKSKKKAYCYIYYLGNYFFSTKNEINIIFEYLHLILNQDINKNTYTVT